MNKIEKLIHDLCPEGVPHRSLLEIGTLTRGRRFVKDDIRTEGVPCIHYGELYTKYGIWASRAYSFLEAELASNLRKAKTGDVIIVSAGETVEDIGKAVAWLGESEVVVHDACYIFRSELDPRYASYFFATNSFRSQIKRFIASSKVSAVSPQNMGKALIPVPPLKVQQEIVSILDKFTELEAELEAELEKRVSQASHMQRKLFANLSASWAKEPGNQINWWPNSRVETRQIGDFSKCIAGATPSSGNAAYWDAGTIPWMSSGEVNNRIIFGTEKMITALGYDSCSTKMLPARSVVVALAGQGKTRGMVARTRIELCTNQSLCGILTDESVNSDYLYHYLKSQYRELREMSSGDGGRGGLNLEIIRSVPVPIPPLEVQEQVAGILDKLEQLIADVSHGLPAEIQARRKQYEYYRNKLLTFKELDAA